MTVAALLGLPLVFEMVGTSEDRSYLGAAMAGREKVAEEGRRKEV